jgi:hypothetical protein
MAGTLCRDYPEVEFVPERRDAVAAAKTVLPVRSGGTVWPTMWRTCRWWACGALQTNRTERRCAVRVGSQLDSSSMNVARIASKIGSAVTGV